LLLAVVLYLAFLPLWWAALDGVAWVSGTCADFLYHLFDPQVSISPYGKIINVLVRLPGQGGLGAEPYKLSLRMDTVTYGMPMLAALAVATRADSVRAKARALAAGLLAMMLLTVPVVMMWGKLATLQLEDRMMRAPLNEVGNRSSFFYYAFHGYAFSQPVVAIAVWFALLTLGLFKSKPKARPAIIAAGRNASCPCGSGQKYKRCCGGRAAHQH
jgi:hypothetical protein